MERKGLQAMLIDGVVADLGGPRTKEFLDKCSRLIDWDKMAASIAGIFADSDPSKGGAPHWPLATMLKCTMLQKWFGLSDPQLEEMLLDRLSFRRFVGLSLADKTPDETTFVVFRGRLRKSGLIAELFDTVTNCLRAKGVIVEKGTLVDATLIETSLGSKRPDGTSTTDPAASKTYKHSRPYHGFKAHVATDRNGIITDYVYDTASSSDHAHADHLLRNEKQAAYADSGYMSAERKAQLEARGVFYGIVYRRVKGQKELTPEQKAHNRAVAKIRAFVEHPFAWMRKMNFWRARYRGLQRNAVDFALRAIAYNWKRSFSLLPIAA